jgi:hypothetical protein
MYWLSLADCLMITWALLFVYYRPSHLTIHGLVLLCGFLIKERIQANPLVISRLLVLFVSIMQLYVLRPLATLWKRVCTRCPLGIQRRLCGRNHSQAHICITCLHYPHTETQEGHHDHHVVFTPDELCCDCDAFLVHYTTKGKPYAILVANPPSTAEAILHKWDAIQELFSAWPRPLKVKSVKLVVSGKQVCDLMPAICQLLGPLRDGHLLLDIGTTPLGVGDIPVFNAMLWLSMAHDPSRHTQILNDIASERFVSLEVESTCGGVTTERVDIQHFNIGDMYTMCVRC